MDIQRIWPCFWYGQHVETLFIVLRNADRQYTTSVLIFQLPLLSLLSPPPLFLNTESFLPVYWKSVTAAVCLSVCLCFSQIWELKKAGRTWRWYSLHTTSHCNPAMLSALEQESRIIENCVWATALEKRPGWSIMRHVWCIFKTARTMQRDADGCTVRAE